MNLLILSFISAFCITFCVTPLIIKIAKKLGLVDDADKRKHPAHTHHGVIPRAGGLALLAGIVVPIFLFLPINKVVAGVVASSILAVAIGLWDDYHDLSPYFRFLANIATAIIVVGAGIGVPFITNPFGGVIHLDTWRISFSFLGTHSILVFADLFAILWIVWTMNIVGWSSGVDGQMPGFVTITALLLGLMSLQYSAHDVSQIVVASIAFITAGAFLGFLPWNFYPQKIMPGYGGKTLAGLMIATVAILSGGKIGSALLVLAIPMLDALYALIRRVLAQKSPFHPDRNHLHHRLLDVGWGKRRIALFYWSVSAMLGLLILPMTSEQKVFTFFIVAFAVGGILIWLSATQHQLSKPIHKQKL